MKIAVVIPSYNVRHHVLGVISRIGTEVALIYVVDDCCPQLSGQYVQDNCSDKRVKILFHSLNRGVGGAMCTGYAAALQDGAEIIVKIDGDGQMDPGILQRFTAPIQDGLADYTKGNRFFNLDTLWRMPWVRLVGNSGLSLINKVTTGYWNCIDPTNGYTAIHRGVLSMIPLEKIDPRYFFESDILFRLSTLRAVVLDIPMDAFYGDEKSSLNIKKVLVEFPPKFFVRIFKRIVYQYIFREFNIGTLCFFLGLPCFVFGVLFGAYSWWESGLGHVLASSGTVMLAALPIFIGFQLLLMAVFFDVSNYPKIPLVRLFRYVHLGNSAPSKDLAEP